MRYAVRDFMLDLTEDPEELGGEIVEVIETNPQVKDGKYRVTALVKFEEPVLSADETQNYWRGLLSRYMTHVGEQEGVDFTDRLSDDLFTTFEQEVLQSIARGEGPRDRRS